MISKIIAQYLDKEGAESLHKDLSDAGIKSVIKRHGLPRFLGGMINFQVMVASKDVQSAQCIVKRFEENAKTQREELKQLLLTQCPGCGSKNIQVVEKKSILQKIIYIGVTVHQCKDCYGKWFT